MKPVTHTRTWHGTTYTLTQTPVGWVCSNGYTYSSLSAAAKDITKQSISGPLFWGVSSRKQPTESPKVAKGAPRGTKSKTTAEAEPKAAKRVGRKGAAPASAATKNATDMAAIRAAATKAFARQPEGRSLAELEKQYEAARAELLARLEAEGRAIVERLGKIKAG